MGADFNVDKPLDLTKRLDRSTDILRLVKQLLPEKLEPAKIKVASPEQKITEPIPAGAEATPIRIDYTKRLEREIITLIKQEMPSLPELHAVKLAQVLVLAYKNGDLK